MCEGAKAQERSFLFGVPKGNCLSFPETPPGWRTQNLPTQILCKFVFIMNLTSPSSKRLSQRDAGGV